MNESRPQKTTPVVRSSVTPKSSAVSQYRCHGFATLDCAVFGREFMTEAALANLRMDVGAK
jgi:hypothetical protein